MSGGNYGPVPARLMFLSDLCGRASGDKVRFLGCVTKYTIQTAILTLKHKYPSSCPNSATALVNIDLILPNLKPTDTQIGEWVNVIGYITAPPCRRQRTRAVQNTEVFSIVNVQALMLWTAGAVKLGNYERVLEERQEVERRLPPAVNKHGDR